MSQMHTIDAGDGQLTVSTHRARVLAVTLPGMEGNLIYEDAQGAGGDRLWIAPEAAYYWKDVEQARSDPFRDYGVPECVDPGRYRTAEAGNGHVTLVNAEIELTDHRVNRTIRLDAERQVRAIDLPDDLPAGLSSVSFAITNTLTLRDGDPGAVAQAWDLLQVWRGGVILCPTTRPLTEAPTSYYDLFGDSVSWSADCVRFHVDGKRQIKMGLPPQVTTGRMGYLRPLPEVPGRDTLIVRIFAPLVGEPYVDVPLAADKSVRFGRDCLQTYSDDDTFGPFGEMEHHDPALVVGRAPTVRSGTSVTHIIAGDADTVRLAGAMLLGVDLTSGC